MFTGTHLVCPPEYLQDEDDAPKVPEEGGRKQGDGMHMSGGAEGGLSPRPKRAYPKLQSTVLCLAGTAARCVRYLEVRIVLGGCFDWLLARAQERSGATGSSGRRRGPGPLTTWRTRVAGRLPRLDAQAAGDMFLGCFMAVVVARTAGGGVGEEGGEGEGGGGVRQPRQPRCCCFCAKETQGRVNRRRR